jgi:hypothetical protein
MLKRREAHLPHTGFAGRKTPVQEGIFASFVAGQKKKKYTKSPNHNKTYPNKPIPGHHIPTNQA